MNVRKSLGAGFLAFGSLFVSAAIVTLGFVLGTADANAQPLTSDRVALSSLEFSQVSPTSEIAMQPRPVCQWPHYQLTRDRNGRWYCKWAPVNRRDR